MAALNGLSVTCLATGGATPVGQEQALPSRMWWSEAPATGVASSNLAPGQANEFGPNIFRVYSTVACWVSIGAAPNSNTSPRVYLPALAERDYIVQPGDKLMWQADV